MPRARSPAQDGESSDPSPDHHHAFSPEERPLQLDVAAVAAEGAPRPHHAVARHVPRRAFAHDVADGPRGSRLARHGSDVAVGRHAPDGNPADCGEYRGRESASSGALSDCWRHGVGDCRMTADGWCAVGPWRLPPRGSACVCGAGLQPRDPSAGSGSPRACVEGRSAGLKAHLPHNSESRPLIRSRRRLPLAPCGGRLAPRTSRSAPTLRARPRGASARAVATVRPGAELGISR